MAALDTIPPQFELASPETVPLSFDVSSYLGAGESPTSPSFTVTNADTGQDYTAQMVAGQPSLSGNTITIVVHRAASGQQYWLTGTFTVSPTKVLSFRTKLIADF